MGKSNTDDGVQPSVRSSEQSRNSVLGIGSSDDNDKLDDDKYADLIDNYVFDININNVVHNIYIDHINKHDDSGFHHHHRTGNLNDHNVIHHNLDNHHDRSDDHDHCVVHHNKRGREHNYDLYGAANHDHGDDGATEHRTE